MAGDPATTSAPAYDDLERFAYARHRTASPYTVLELLARGDGHAPYEAARASYRRWRRTGVLVEDPLPAYYRYEQHELRHGVPAVQRSLLVALSVEPPGVPTAGGLVSGVPTAGGLVSGVPTAGGLVSGVPTAGGLVARGGVLPHEQVDVARVGDRLERLQAVPVDVAPVFALYRRPTAALRDLLARPPRTPPLAALTDEAGVDHRVWALHDAADLSTVRAGLRDLPVVIADGHHRWATARAYAARQAAGHAEADAPWLRTLAMLVDADVHGPVVLPVHRLLHRAPGALLDLLGADFEISDAPGDPAELTAALDATATPGAIVLGLRVPGRGALLRARDPEGLRGRLPAERSERWRALDAAVLAGAVLPRLGVAPAEVEPTPDAVAAAAAVDSGSAAALVLLRPVDAATVYEVATGGEPMPAKTTWFRPKPRTGLILRSVV